MMQAPHDASDHASHHGDPKAPVVLITGASRGIGASTALAFAQAGWRVAITARTVVDGQTHAHQLRRPDGQMLAGSLASTAAAVQATGGAVFAHPMDLLDLTSLDTAADAVLAHFGRVDVLINNAVYQDRETNALIDALHADALQRTFLGNVVAPLHLTRRLLPAMLDQGGGLIINISSGAGKYDPPIAADQGGWGFAYGASKAALARMAGCLRTEYGTRGIRACTVNPGLVSTEAVTATLGDAGVLQSRFGAMTPQVIGAALLWLATHPDAAGLIAKPAMLDLQDLVRAHGLHAPAA